MPLQPGGGRNRAHEALLQRLLHRRPQATGKDRGLHLRPLPGDEREARKEHRWRVERHGRGGEGFLCFYVFYNIYLYNYCMRGKSSGTLLSSQKKLQHIVHRFILLSSATFSFSLFQRSLAWLAI